jgi:hypothetical protein
MKRTFVTVAIVITAIAAVLAHPAFADMKLATLKVKGMVCQS